MEYMDTIEPADAPTIEQEFEFEEIKEIIKKVLKQLTEREQTVIKLRFGLDNKHEPMYYNQIATMYLLTSERIKQIEAKALRKLRYRLLVSYDVINWFEYGATAEQGLKYRKTAKQNLADPVLEFLKQLYSDLILQYSMAAPPSKTN